MDQGQGGFGGGYQRPASGAGGWGGPSPVCAMVEPLLYAFRTQTLDRERILQVAQHVATCPYCTARVRQLDGGARGTPAAHQPPPGAAAPGRVSSWGQPTGMQDSSAPYSHGPYPTQASRPDAYPSTFDQDMPTLGPPRDDPRWPLAASAARQGSSAARKPLPEFLRPPLVWFTGTAALCGLLALTFIIISLPLLAAPRTSSHAHAAATKPAATVAPASLPAFSLPVFADWRAAYIAADGKVHIAALDGSSDIIGPALSLNGADTRGGIGTFQKSGALRQAVAISPDGHTLAYINQPPLPNGAGVAPPSGPIVLAPLAGGGSDRVISAAANDLYWSPDGTRLAFDSPTGIFIVNATNAQGALAPQLVAPKAPLGTARILGWIDGAHLAMLSSQGAGQFTPLPTPTAAPTATAAPTITPSVTASPSAAPGGPSASVSAGADRSPLLRVRSSPTTTIVTLNVQTGDTNLIVDASQDGIATLSPDGKIILLSSTGGCSPGPCGGSTAGNAALVDTTTGQLQPLTDSIMLLPPTGTFFWSPDSLSVAQTIPNKDTQPDSWLVNVVDLEQGQGATLRQGVFALGWSPDGKVIVVGDVGTVGEGKVQASAILTASPNKAPVALPGKVTEFLGFVKTA